jgi:hypothetical protein
MGRKIFGDSIPFQLTVFPKDVLNHRKVAAEKIALTVGNVWRNICDFDTCRFLGSRPFPAVQMLNESGRCDEISVPSELPSMCGF